MPSYTTVHLFYISLLIRQIILFIRLSVYIIFKSERKVAIYINVKERNQTC